MASKTEFKLEILDFAEIHALPDVWTVARYRALLDLFEFEDADTIGDADLAEMAAMAAQDLGWKAASDRVLEVVFGASMSPGVRQNLVDDLPGERPWELFADLNRQAGIFEAVEFLEKAFPNRFGLPDAARVRLHVTAMGIPAGRALRKGPSASLVVRLLADAMDERAVLRRLYEDQLRSARFPEADAILWRIDVAADDRESEPPACELVVHSSLQWLGPLANARGSHVSHAEPDA